MPGWIFGCVTNTKFAWKKLDLLNLQSLGEYKKTLSGHDYYDELDYILWWAKKVEIRELVSVC